MLVCCNALSHSWVHFLLEVRRIWKSYLPFSPHPPKIQKATRYLRIIIFSSTEKSGQNRLKIAKHEIKEETACKILRLACSTDGASEASTVGSVLLGDPAQAQAAKKWLDIAAGVLNALRLYPASQFPVKFNEKLFVPQSDATMGKNVCLSSLHGLLLSQEGRIPSIRAKE